MYKNLNPDDLGISGRPSEVIELALSYGFKGIDLDLVDFSEQVKTHGLAHARRLIDSARLKVGGFRLPVAWEEDSTSYQQDVERLTTLAELAQQIGCTRTTTTIQPASDMRPYHENFEFHRRRLSEISAALAPFKISLGLEFLAPLALRQGRAFQFIQSFDALLLLLKTIAAPNIGVALDLWHWHVAGGTLDQIRTLRADQIITVCVADAEPGSTAVSADEQRSRRLPGETGAIDAAAVLTALAELGYGGPVTPKPHKSRLAGLSRDKIVKQAGAALDQVWKAAGLSPPGKLQDKVGDRR
jgi:sugar phosphate isomerase/epimerase